MPRSYTNRKEIESQPSLEKKFGKYLSKHSIDETRGYIDGITEMFDLIENLCYIIDGDYFSPRGSNEAHSMLLKVFISNSDTIKSWSSKLDDLKNRIVNPNRNDDATLHP